MPMRNFFFMLLMFVTLTINAQSGFVTTTDVLNVVDDKLQVTDARFETIRFSFDLNKRKLQFNSDISGDFEEQIVNYNTGVIITPVLLNEQSYGFELANAIHEVWTNGAYYQLYATLKEPSNVYVIVEHPYVGSVNRRIYFKSK